MYINSMAQGTTQNPNPRKGDMKIPEKQKTTKVYKGIVFIVVNESFESI